VAGLVLVGLSRMAWIDPVLGLLVAVNIVYTGVDLLRRSFDGLMDRALAAEEIRKIRDAIEAHLEPQMTFHALRTRRAGARRFTDFHLLVPGQCTVEHAHDIEMAIGRAIAEAVPGIEVTTHIEPIEEPQAWNDTQLTIDE
jgi:cation diffusion facilitator family transporter